MPHRATDIRRIPPRQTSSATAVFTVSQVVASGSESECTAQVVDDGSNDGETADDAQACSPEQNGTDADSANEDSN